jgi:hypothetical protein
VSVTVADAFRPTALASGNLPAVRYRGENSSGTGSEAILCIYHEIVHTLQDRSGGRPRARAQERECVGQRANFFSYEKNVITHKQKIKLNSNYTIKFVSINASKLDLIWICLDKVTSGPHSG